MNAQEFLRSTIKQRRYLINHAKSKRNAMYCNSIIKELEKYMHAYGSKWTSEQWKRFLKDHYEEIKAIIPGNSNYNSKIETLNALIL